MHPKGTYTQQPENITTSSASSENVTVMSPYMTRKEIAEYLRCSVDTIDNRVKVGLIKKEVVCGCTLYPIEDNKIKRNWIKKASE